MKPSEVPEDRALDLRSSAAWLVLAVLLAAYPSVVVIALDWCRGVRRVFAPDWVFVERYPARPACGPRKHVIDSKTQGAVAAQLGWIGDSIATSPQSEEQMKAFD